MIPPRVRHQSEYRLFALQESTRSFVDEYERQPTERGAVVKAIQLAWAWSECASLEERTSKIHISFEKLPRGFLETVIAMDPEDLTVLPPRVLAEAAGESWAVVQHYALHREPPCVMFQDGHEVVVYMGRDWFYSFGSIEQSLIFIDDHWNCSPDWQKTDRSTGKGTTVLREEIEHEFGQECNFSDGMRRVWKWLCVEFR
ncbi:hypothetical protein F5050DRAFT_1808633 [Lentinula boryana]|uniref:Uncharacterized protein n=1 Tax=Lentinula boryana TaxID=40481 RepID=A0ABQ8QA99_9AGAR|nr:hypothetical protein F5050DRAFT_1808633 [Lentinula boryana]